MTLRVVPEGLVAADAAVEASTGRPVVVSSHLIAGGG